MRSIQIKKIKFARMLAALFCLTLIAGELCAKDEPAKSDDIDRLFKNLNSDIKKVTLENGLRLIMMKRSFSPTLALYIKYGSGGVDEQKDEVGIAHLLEHMLFKGTKIIGTKNYPKERPYLEAVNYFAARMDYYRRVRDKAIADNDKSTQKSAENEIQKWQMRLRQAQKDQEKFIIHDEDSSIYSQNGEQGYNAYTSRDLTNYQVNLPANRVEVWARLESDRAVNSVLRELYTERDVITEERRMRVDNIARSLMMEQFLEKVYGEHPYGRSLIGPMQSILYLNYDQAYQYYRLHYAPNNMVIAMVGDVDFSKSEQLIKEYFGKLKPMPLPRPPSPKSPDDRPLNFTFKGKGSPVLYMAWFKPPLSDPDTVPLELLAEILAGNKDSRLFRRLVLKERLADEIDTYTSFPGERYTNLFLLSSVPASGKSYDSLKSAILDELDQIKKNGVTEDELERTRRRVVTDFIYALRSSPMIANQLSYYETVTGDYKNLFSRIKEFEKVTVKDIQKAATRYLLSDKVKSAELISENTSEQKGEE